MCEIIISFKPDVVVTEKGLSDLAAHYFTKVCWERTACGCECMWVGVRVVCM